MSNFLSKTGSVVTKPWKITSMTAGKMEADSVPSNTQVKAEIKSGFRERWAATFKDVCKIMQI